VLRTAAGKLLSTDDIVGRVIAAKGFDAADRILRAAIREQVGSIVKRLRRSGAIENIAAGRASMEVAGAIFTIEYTYLISMYCTFAVPCGYTPSYALRQRHPSLGAPESEYHVRALKAPSRSGTHRTVTRRVFTTTT
jgi:hypothetical protein